MIVKCTCITSREWKILIRDPWCAAHGELPVKAKRPDGTYLLPVWLIGFDCILDRETGQLTLLDGSPLTA